MVDTPTQSPGDQPPPDAHHVVARHVVVVIGGGPLSQRAIELAREFVDAGATVIAADSGLDHAVAAQLSPTLLVGDLDSISASGRMWAYAHGVEVDEFPTDKDFTDTEIALERAVHTAGTGALLLVGGLDPTDPRLDHVLGTIAALGSPTLASLVSIRAVLGTDEFQVVHAPHTAAVDVEAGQTFSLLALHGDADGVTLTGARWPLTHATLRSTRALGVSNVADSTVTLSVGSGIVTVVIP